MSRRTKYSYELRKEILRQYGDKGIKPINNKYSGKFKEDVLSYYYSHNILLRATAVYTSNINVSISEINYLFGQFAFEKKKAVF